MLLLTRFLRTRFFLLVLDKQLIEEFKDPKVISKEPELPGGGRADFLFEDDRKSIYVEVKSCTYVEDGVAKFPDSPTGRGRRHLRSLMDLIELGFGAFVVFIVQRPDVNVFSPYRDIDPVFADLLSQAIDFGVGIRVISTAFEPPTLYLKEDNLEVKLV